jgi:hypothetical protein
MTTCLFIGMLMPAIRAIYFSTRAHEKKRGSILEKPLKINSLAMVRRINPDAACAGRPTNK